jgi:hypothetical protein
MKFAALCVIHSRQVEKIMTLEEATERCAKALLRAKGQNESLWQQYPHVKSMAKDVVICLAELDFMTLEGSAHDEPPPKQI